MLLEARLGFFNCFLGFLFYCLLLYLIFYCLGFIFIVSTTNMTMSKKATTSNAPIEFELDGEGDDVEEDDIRDDGSNDENMEMFYLDDDDDF